MSNKRNNQNQLTVQSLCSLSKSCSVTDTHTQNRKELFHWKGTYSLALNSETLQKHVLPLPGTSLKQYPLIPSNMLKLSYKDKILITSQPTSEKDTKSAYHTSGWKVIHCSNQSQVLISQFRWMDLLEEASTWPVHVANVSQNWQSYLHLGLTLPEINWVNGDQIWIYWYPKTIS